jgi:hypothetical protein
MMNMNDYKNPLKKRLSEQLPSHSPDPGVWQRLSEKLDVMSAEAAYLEKLQQLPVHSPDQGTWKIIYTRLNRIAFYKTGVRIALSAAAGLVMLFTVWQLVATDQNKPEVTRLAKQQQSVNNVAITKQSVTEDAGNTLFSKTPETSPNAKSATALLANADGTKQSSVILNIAETTPEKNVKEHTSGSNESASSAGIPVQTEIAPVSFAQSSENTESRLPTNEAMKTESEVQKTIIKNEETTSISVPDKKYYTPDEPKTGRKNNYFALAMNYLPENINNGNTNSLFHNVDVTASYNKEKVRFNTSLGMAYNQEQLAFDMDYNINTPVTAVGDGGQTDTIGYNVDRIEAEYQGTEKHQYFTYNLGFGRRLFSIGKFSTWINAGAGFGIRLNNPDLVASTEKAIKNQYNAQITSENSFMPEYNNVNINFVTGIDFNYKILNRLSITFTPTSRWYFKPVLTVKNQATDEMTLGFKTGMKFDF